MSALSTTKTGGDVLAEALRAGGIEVVFGLPGVQLDAAFDALARRIEHFRVYHTRHEQATSYMADGYARVTGRAACCLVVPGPGLLNAMPGLATAYAANSPVLCVAGQIRSDSIDKGLGQLHEIPQQLQALRSTVKWAERATTPEQIGPLVGAALAEMRAGRQRPVAVEIPLDVLEATCSSPPLQPPADGPADLRVEQLEEVAHLLRRAERPLLVAGGGVLRSGAWDELRELAERLGAPVLMTANGKGALDARHPLACEPLLARDLLPAADVILAVGTRMARMSGERWRLEPGQRLIRIDADPTELHRSLEPAVAVEADARRALSLLAEIVAPSSLAWQDLDQLRQAADERVQALQPQAAFGNAVRRALPDDTVVLPGMTQVGYWCRLGFPVRRPRSYLPPGYQGTLGAELPTGLGAQVGLPDTRVVVLVGDGGLLYNVSELATAVQHRIPVITVVFNDGAYGNVRRFQRQRFGRLIASDLHNPDFGRLAASFEVASMRAEDPEALSDALGRALEIEGPVLIEVPVGEMPDPWALLRGS